LILAAQKVFWHAKRDVGDGKHPGGECGARRRVPPLHELAKSKPRRFFGNAKKFAPANVVS
jgi:hypothetical protein